MIKVFALLPVRPDLTVEQFHHHWSTVHRDHALRIERIRRYVQAHRLRPGLPGLAEAEWEGVPEVWFDTLESAVAQRTDPQYTRFARLDEPRFIDMPRLRRVITVTRVVRDPGPARTKLMVFAHAPWFGTATRHPVRQDGSSMCETLLERAPELCGVTISRAVPVENLPLLPDGTAPARQPFDVVLELWWPHFEAVRAGWAARGEAILEVLDGHLDLSRARGFLCEELRVVER